MLAVVFAVGSLHAQSQTERQKAETKLRKVYQTILEKYVAQVDPDKLSEAAIRGMLRELDPYSLHIDESNSQRLDDLTTGEYGGVGIRMGRMNDSLVVISPTDGTPAYRQGVLAGDRIIKIDSVWTRNMDMDRAAQLMRGEKGSVVKLRVKRMGETETIDFELEREMIKVPDLSYSGLLENRVAYVRLANFSRYSAEELEKAVRRMHKSGMRGLIIDLRGNPGGLLSAALRSADLFIVQGELLLETRGRISQSNKKYNARRRPIIPEELPMAVLVDGGSASASEILSGVLQDYDRAIVVGESSFGKGLVQTITQLSKEERLKLTTAKYYLPSGRLIQKHALAPEILYEDTLVQNLETFHSENEREIEAGGGIVPDVTVEDIPVSSFERRLWNKRAFFKFALELVEQNQDVSLHDRLEPETVDSFYVWLDEEKLLPLTDLEKWLKSMPTPDDSTGVLHDRLIRLSQEFSDLAASEHREILEENRSQILAALEMEVAHVLGGNGARVAASLRSDPVVMKALELLQSHEEMELLLSSSPY